jgi:hypothetical protein
MNVTLGGLVQGCFVTIVYSAKTLLFWQWLGAGRPGGRYRLGVPKSPVARALQRPLIDLGYPSRVLLNVWFVVRF